MNQAKVLKKMDTLKEQLNMTKKLWGCMILTGMQP